MGSAYAETTNCEVDDWIASYVNLYSANNEMIISSFDSDFFQLISKNVSIDNIIQNAEKIKKQSVRESIIKGSQRLRRNLQLIKLEGKNAVPYELDKMLFAYNGITTTEVLRGIGLK